jgi:hypothetical protein
MCSTSSLLATSGLASDLPAYQVNITASFLPFFVLINFYMLYVELKKYFDFYGCGMP